METHATPQDGPRYVFDTELALQKFYESAPMLMGIVEVEDGDIIHIYDNAAAIRFFGLPSKSEGRKTSALGTPPETIRLWIQHYQQALREQRPVQFEYTHAREGDDISFSVVVTYMETTPQGADRFSYIAQDTSEQNKLQGLLKTSPFKKIIDAIPQIVWTATPEGFLDWYNEQWFEYSGIGGGPDWHAPDTPMHPDDKKRTWERWERSLRTGEVFENEYRFLRKSDQQYRWFLGRAVPIRDENGEIIKWIGSDTDIHEQKVLLGKIKEERDLRENIIASVSHDLRTPLTAAKMSAQLMLRKTNDPAITKGAVRISDNMDRADTMIRDLLDVSRVRAGEKIRLEMGRCHLRRICGDTLNELSTIHGDRFVLLAPEEIEGFWSCQGIRRILENLCTNAIKYGDPDAEVRVHLKKKSGKALIEVHNLGEPIPGPDQQQLWEPFQRTEASKSSSQKGWGIGLSLVKALTLAHKGEVMMESLPEKGTTFRIILPLSVPSDS